MKKKSKSTPKSTSKSAKSAIKSSAKSTAKKNIFEDENNLLELDLPDGATQRNFNDHAYAKFAGADDNLLEIPGLELAPPTVSTALETPPTKTLDVEPHKILTEEATLPVETAAENKTAASGDSSAKTALSDETSASEDAPGIELPDENKSESAPALEEESRDESVQTETEPTEASQPTISQSQSAAQTARGSGLAYGAAIFLFFAVIVMLVLGWLADRLFGSSPWGIVIGIILGAIIGFYQFFKINSQIFKK